MAWPGIVASRRDVDSPGKQNLFDDLHDRDETLRESCFGLTFPEFVVTSAFSTYEVVHTEEIYIPPWAKNLVAGAQGKCTSSFLFFQWKLDGVLFQAAGAITDTSYVELARHTYTDIPAALLGTRVDLVMEGAQIAGTAEVKSSYGPVCRFTSA